MGGGRGAADLQGGAHFFSNTEKKENKREQGDQHFSRGGPGLRGLPDATGLFSPIIAIANKGRLVVARCTCGF